VEAGVGLLWRPPALVARENVGRIKKSLNTISRPHRQKAREKSHSGHANAAGGGGYCDSEGEHSKSSGKRGENPTSLCHPPPAKLKLAQDKEPVTISGLAGEVSVCRFALKEIFPLGPTKPPLGKRPISRGAFY